jgi:hypothetical protein
MEMTKQDAELSPLARQLLGSSGAMKLFTQTEFDAALTEAKAEIMAIAIQTTKQAIAIEREECAKLADDCVNIELLGDAIRNRMRPKND